MIETLANGYSSESSQRELSNEYQHDRVLMIFKKICILMLRTKEASALERLKVVNMSGSNFYCGIISAMLIPCRSGLIVAL